jgi:hypothetical protein
MSWSKREFVLQAFRKAGLAAYVFNLTPSQLQAALVDLDSMMATWNFKGIRIGYPLPSSQSASDLDDETNVPDSANEAIYTNLAIRIAPDFGKAVMPNVYQTAKASYDGLLSLANMPMEMQLPGTMPAGAGNKPWRNTDNPFLNNPVDPLLAGNDSAIDFE